MNRILIAAFTTTLLCASLLAQSTQSPSPESAPEQPQQIPTTEQPAAPTTPTQAAPAQATPANGAPRISPGSVIPARLSKSVDAKKAKKGDEVVATVTQDMKNNAGTVLVPKDTKIIGHVTEAQARSKEQKESEIAIAFDRAVPKNGEPMQMPMSIQAIIAPPSSNPASAQQPSSDAGAGTSGSPAYGGGRSGSMGGAGAQAPSAPQTSASAPAEGGTQAQPQITGNTQGVVGIPNLKLSAAPDPAQGSVVTSEKNNVKLDDGTFLLLRVNQ